jgi:PST family polysaccharide transporter
MAVYFRELVLKAETSEVIRSFWKGALFLLIPSLFILTIGITMVPYGVELFLRPDQQIVSTVFQTLVWSIPICYVGHLTTQMLVVQGRRKTYLSIMFSGALINIILNYYFIPIFHLSGAAYATLITEGFILIMTGVFSVILIYKPRTLA